MSILFLYGDLEHCSSGGSFATSRSSLYSMFAEKAETRFRNFAEGIREDSRDLQLKTGALTMA